LDIPNNEVGFTPDMPSVIIWITFATAVLITIAVTAWPTKRLGEYKPTTLVRIHPKDNPGLLLAAMRTFENSGHISFKISPLQDLPLTSENIDTTWKRIAWERDDDFGIPENERLMQPSNFVHVEISVDGRCVFGAWDNFHEECVIATDEFPLEVLDRLVADGIIRSYTIDTDPDRGRYWHRP
jgi:hypothetical protein